MHEQPARVDEAATVDSLARLLEPPLDPTDELTGLERAGLWLGSLLANVTDSISVIDGSGRMLFLGGHVPLGLGYAQATWRDLDVWDLVHPDDLPSAEAAFADSLGRPGEEVSVELRIRAADGSWADLVATAVNRLDDPTVRGVVITTRDITSVRRAERLASSQAAVLEMIARAAPLADVFERCVELVEENGVGGRSSIYLLDDDRRLEMRAGRAPRELDDLIREPPRDPPRGLCDVSIATAAPVFAADLEADPTVPAGLREVARSVGVRAAWSQPIVALGADHAIGSLSTLYEAPHVPDRHEQRVGEVACSLVAIALARVETETRLAHEALHDALTGLPNRVLLLDRLDHALARHGGSTSDLAVLFCDLDRFKVVNDSLGHGVGDQLLVAFAERLRATIGSGNTVARFGGDEFVVLLDDPGERHDPIVVAERIAATLEVPFALPGGHEVHLTASIGLARADDHATGDTWLRDADAAMYRAKEQGRDRLVLFDSDMRAAAVRRLEIETDLRRAVERGEMVVHYQPVVDLVTGAITGAEALVRWEHPRRGLLSPGDFIEVAEENGTIERVGRWVLDRAVGDIGRLVPPERRDRFQLGVNLSVRQLDSPGLDQVVDATCRRHGWPHRSLLLEVTETGLTQGLEGPLQLLDRIRRLGVELAIDDFGTGHSSLARLGRMPVTQVKVDCSFVAAIDDGERRLGRMAEAVSAVASALGLRTTAEGVETPAQLARLREMHCDQAQGYLFSKPLPLQAFADLLGADPRW